MAEYITLRNSVQQAAHLIDPNTEQGKRFRVVFGNGFRPGLRKTNQGSETVGGRIDVSIGPIFYEWQGTLRLTEILTTSGSAAGYGDKADLETYYKLNNPSGSPNNLITLVDHYGIEHHGYIIGDHKPDPMTIFITGTEAHYFIPFQFVERDEVT